MGFTALFAMFSMLQPYVGTYKIIPEECDEIRPVVERSVARMNFLIRSIARGRLLKTQVAFPSITVSADASYFRITHAGGTNIGHTDLSSPVHAKAPDGTPIVVRLLPGPPLVQTYESSEGKRENTYLLADSGTRLTVVVRITSPRLPEEISYRLVYRRIP
jgi:hypothetical protein